MSSTEPVAPPRCYVHADRPAGSVCRRCGRPICPDCMHEAPVGWQCTSCLREGARLSPYTRWRPQAARTRGLGRLGNTRLTPAVVALIAVNVAVYLWESRNLGFDERRFGMWPAAVHYAGQWYRLITAAFLHASPEHILFNMVTLAIVGPPLEAEIGKVRFLAVYLASAVGGSVGSYLLSPANVLGVGASGAIFGVMGAYFVVAWLRRWEVRQILALLAINLVLGFTATGIDWRDHLGGLVVGSVVCAGLTVTPGRVRLRGRPPGPPSWPPPPVPAAGPAVSGVGLIVQSVAVVVATGVVLGLLLQLPPGHVNL